MERGRGRRFACLNLNLNLRLAAKWRALLAAERLKDDTRGVVFLPPSSSGYFGQSPESCRLAREPCAPFRFTLGVCCPDLSAGPAPNLLAPLRLLGVPPVGASVSSEVSRPRD